MLVLKHEGVNNVWMLNKTTSTETGNTCIQLYYKLKKLLKDEHLCKCSKTSYPHEKFSFAVRADKQPRSKQNSYC